MSESNLDWAIYGYNRDPLTRLDYPDTQHAEESHFGHFRDFQSRAAAGTLPAYTFLEPNFSAGGNSQHPNYDVAQGEQLIHDVYYALRNGPGWNDTLLIITYDEHGGNYDHVPPPWGATPPDYSVGEWGVRFHSLWRESAAPDYFAAHRGRDRIQSETRNDRPHLGPENN